MDSTSSGGLGGVLTQNTVSNNGVGGRSSQFGQAFDASRSFSSQGAYHPDSVIERFAPSGIGYAAADRSRLSYSGTPISEAPNGETTSNWQNRLNLLMRPRTVTGE